MMKKFGFIIILFGFVLALSCSKDSKVQPIKLNIDAIDSVWKAGNLEFRASYCKMEILEDPENTKSHIISIPVMRIFTKSKTPGAPVLVLNSGPGISNFKTQIPGWLLESHDLVIVGYRGIDGSVSLNMPELIEPMKNKNPLSEANLALIGRAWDVGFKRLRNKDIDVTQYNLVNIAKDMETARIALGYKDFPFHIYAVGFGARIAYVYSQIYPHSVYRMMMIKPNAPGKLVMEPQSIDQVLIDYSELGKSDPYFSKISPDILASMKKTLSNLPESSSGIYLDKDKLLISVLLISTTDEGVAEVFDAFADAEKGDYSGLAYMVSVYDKTVPYANNYGAWAAIAMSSDFDEERDYIKSLSCVGNTLLGSPFSKLMFGSLSKSGYRPQLLDERFRNVFRTEKETYFLSGNFDILCPFENVTVELEPKFTNSKSFMLTDYNYGDIGRLDFNNFMDFTLGFIDAGENRSANFKNIPMNYKPDVKLSSLMKKAIP